MKSILVRYHPGAVSVLARACFTWWVCWHRCMPVCNTGRADQAALGIGLSLVGKTGILTEVFQGEWADSLVERSEGY
jgi:hypothetical protein